MVSPGQNDSSVVERGFAIQRKLRTFGLLLAVGLAFAVGLPATAQQAAEPKLPLPRAEKEQPRASSGPDILPTSFGRELALGTPVTFYDVLKLASLGNLDIAQARVLVQRSRANLQLISSRYLPNLNIGATYDLHDGQIQKTEGNIITVNRDSLFVGGGPSLSVNLGDVLFLPAEGKRLLEAVRIGQVRITNDTLLAVADAYFDVLLSRRRLAGIEEGLEFLTSTTESELRGGSQGLLPLIRAFVRSGNALPSDQARVEADVVRAHEERLRAAEEVRTTSAELARLLRMDPTTFLLPADDYRWPLRIQGSPWFDAPLEVLITQALRSRPELAENNALIEAAIARYRAAKWQPYLPTVSTTYNWGGFGGGPALVGKAASGATIYGKSGTIADFNTRDDLQVNMYWRLQGLGLGNLAQQRDARLSIDQSRIRQIQLQDTVVSQVVRALESIQRGKERIAVVQASLFDDKGQPTGVVYRSLRLNFLRIKSGQGTPLEVLDSSRRLTDILTIYAQALTSYDRARFRMLVRLGLPTPALIDPQCMPLPPPPFPPLVVPVSSPLPSLPAPAESKKEPVGEVSIPAQLEAPAPANKPPTNPPHPRNVSTEPSPNREPEPTPMPTLRPVGAGEGDLPKRRPPPDDGLGAVLPPISSRP